MSHDHGPEWTDRAAERRLRAVFLLTLAYTVAEVVGGIASGSLALLADAGHMATDDLALGLALFAAWAARRPPDAGRTYGFHRVEILAALANGVVLSIVCGMIVWEALRRFAAPPEVDGPMMAIVAAGGLVVNLVAARMLHGHAHSLNARAAFLHVIGDLLGSLGTLAAAALVALFGWRWADPLASVVIAAIIVVGAARLVWESIHVLMEGAPPHLDAREVARALRGLPGVVEVHDLHLWSLRGRAPLLTAHLVVEHGARPHDVLRAARAAMHGGFAIDHLTIQIEPPDFNIQGVGAPPVDSRLPSP